MANDYVTVAELRADMVDGGLSSSTDYDVLLGELISAASRLIDREVGGWEGYFYPTTDSQIRYYDGSGEDEQYVDPLIALTTVSVSESGGRASTSYTDWTEDTDFYVWPYNYSDIGKPIEKLIVDNDSGNKGVFNATKKGVKVTGVFGYSETPPADIEQACKIQSMRWYMRAKQAYQDTSASERLGQMLYTQELDPDVKRLLIPYKVHNAMM
jgi:hypothetical protein